MKRERKIRIISGPYDTSSSSITVRMETPKGNNIEGIIGSGDTLSVIFERGCIIVDLNGIYLPLDKGSKFDDYDLAMLVNYFDTTLERMSEADNIEMMDLPEKKWEEYKKQAFDIYCQIMGIEGANKEELHKYF